MKYFLLISFLGTPALALTVPTCDEIVQSPHSIQYNLSSFSGGPAGYRYELSLFSTLDNPPDGSTCDGGIENLAAASCIRYPDGHLSKVKLHVVKNACVHPEES